MPGIGIVLTVFTEHAQSTIAITNAPSTKMQYMNQAGGDPRIGSSPLTQSR